MHFLCLGLSSRSPTPSNPPFPFVSLTFVNETPGPGTPANPQTRFAWLEGGVFHHGGQSECRGCLSASFTSWTSIHKKINSFRPQFIHKELRKKKGS